MGIAQVNLQQLSEDGRSSITRQQSTSAGDMDNELGNENVRFGIGLVRDLVASTAADEIISTRLRLQKIDDGLDDLHGRLIGDATEDEVALVDVALLDG